MNSDFSLKAIRRDAGVTQADLAQRLGRPQSHISRVENSPVESMTVRTISAYLQALDTDLYLSVTKHHTPPPPYSDCPSRRLTTATPRAQQPI